MMSKKEENNFTEMMNKIEEEKFNQYHKDTLLIRKLKKKIPKKLFHQIALEIYESEKWSNLEIVNKPTGTYQGKDRCLGKMWVDQYCEFEDSYSGYCYVELSDKTYLQWHYEM